MKRLLLAILLLATVPVGAKEYFQQKVDTKIELRLDDKKHFLHGFETIRYTNNSPDTLRYIYLHLWPNAYSSDRTCFAEQQVSQNNTAFYYSKSADRGFIDSLDIHIDGEPVVPFSATDLPDIARIDLPAMLLPGASIVIETPFRVKIPKVYSRMGHQGQAYYISQWFPKPAVYDRRGWHPLPYLDQGEFFSEIGSYDVQITLPANYVVMATGNCETVSENNWLDSLSRLPFPAGERLIKGGKAWQDSVSRMPPSATAYKTIRFTEQNVHDFAWFADKRFIVRKDTVLVPAGASTETYSVTIYTAFLYGEKDTWKTAIEYIRSTVRYLSEAVGPYPYKTIKAVEGQLKAGGGMEYPTITLISQTSSKSLLRETLVHEVGHNWFYGILATNERDHAWMDEGINTFYERKITDSLKTGNSIEDKFSNKSILSLLYYEAASTGSDQAVANTSTAFTKTSYGYDVYHKAVLMLGWLESYMGKAAFNSAMQDYYTQWHHRHPYPEDMQQIFEQHTTKPVNWFFEGALKTEKGIDFTIKKAHINGDETAIHLKNKSDFAGPVRINAFKNDRLIDSIWTTPFIGDTTVTFHTITPPDKWQLGDEIPDYRLQNNLYRMDGLTHRRALRLRPGLGIGQKEGIEIYLLPALGYNIYNGFMAGVLLHNLSIPQHRLRYAVAPMYSFRSDDFVGAASAGYWIYPHKIFREIVPQIDVKTFYYDSTSLNIGHVLRGRYVKFAPSLSFVLKNSLPLSPVTRAILLKTYMIAEDEFQFGLDAADSLYKPQRLSGVYRYYARLCYTHRDDRTFNPFSYGLEAQAGSGFYKFTAEGQLRIDYNKQGKALHLRGFAGKYIETKLYTRDYSRYWLTSAYTAANDYLYDGTYIGRSEREGFASKQVSIQEGGGKFATPLYGFPLGRSNDWLTSVNLKTDLPLGSLPIRLYLDAATYADANKINPSGSYILYTGGIELHALQDIFLVHIPLLMCADYRDYLKGIYPDKQFANSISFSVQLQNINWLQSVSTAVTQIFK